MGAYWFAALPSKQERSRVTLDFGLSRADRQLRERVVPELGKVWFVRQLSWPVAAIALREQLRGSGTSKASTISHGLEALGCKLEWDINPDSERLLGKRAFGRDSDDEVWAFDKLKIKKHYVQNTHRQAATRTIRSNGGLGLASGPRFDSYVLTPTGQQLADAFLEQPVGKGGGKLRLRLEDWIRTDTIELSATLREAVAPSYPSDRERELVHARVFGVTGDACERRVNAAHALGHGAEHREMLEVASRLRDSGHTVHANDVVAAHAFGMMIDRSRDLAAVMSTRVEEATHGWPLAEAKTDKAIKSAAAALKASAAVFLHHADIAKFDEPRSRAYAHAVAKDVLDIVTKVARETAEVFIVAESRIMRGPLFRIVESSAAKREALEQKDDEDGADTIEPDGTHQTFRLANLHALARDLRGKA